MPRSIIPSRFDAVRTLRLTRRRRALGLVAIGLLSLSACATPTPEGEERASATVAALRIDPGRLATPASWRGVLPCADCSGIATTLTLNPDGTYQRDAAWRGTGGAGDTIAVDLGTWYWDPDSRRIRLHGSTDAPAWFAVTSDGRLTQRDLEGAPIVGDRDYSLEPVLTAAPVAHPARLVLAVERLADAVHGTECRSGLAHPVAMRTDGARPLERAYVRAARRGAPLLVRVRAHLAAEPLGEGDSLVEAWVIDSLLAVEPTPDEFVEACAALRQQSRIAATAWRLVHLAVNDTALPLSPATDVHVAWDRATSRVVGFSGCNRFSAEGTLQGAQLVAGPVMSTKRACADPAATAVESRLLTVLTGAPWLRVDADADTLRWSLGPREVARFVPFIAPPSD